MCSLPSTRMWGSIWSPGRVKIRRRCQDCLWGLICFAGTGMPSLSLPLKVPPPALTVKVTNAPLQVSWFYQKLLPEEVFKLSPTTLFESVFVILCMLTAAEGLVWRLRYGLQAVPRNTQATSQGSMPSSRLRLFRWHVPASPVVNFFDVTGPVQFDELFQIVGCGVEVLVY